MTKRKRVWAETDACPENNSSSEHPDAKDPGVLDVLPGITRKITACGACRKQKVCHRFDATLIGC